MMALRPSTNYGPRSELAPRRTNPLHRTAGSAGEWESRSATVKEEASLITYSEISRRLIEFEEFLRSLGLHRGPDRLRAHSKNVELLASAVDRGNWDSLGDPFDNEALTWALVEGLELVEIHKGLVDYDPNVLKQLYRKVLSGPPQPGEETSKTTIARNTEFELALGSRLRAAGAAVTLGQDADIQVSKWSIATEYVSSSSVKDLPH